MIDFFIMQIDETRQDSDDKETAKMFPDKDQKITCHDLTKDFLVYGTDVICCFITLSPSYLLITAVG